MSMSSHLYERARRLKHFLHERWATLRARIAHAGATSRAVPSSPPEVQPLEPRVYMSGLLSGQVFADVNRDGILGSGEILVPGVVVFIDENLNGQRDTEELSALSNAQGEYSISGVSGKVSLSVAGGSGWAGSASATATVTGDDRAVANVGVLFEKVLGRTGQGVDSPLILTSLIDPTITAGNNIEGATGPLLPSGMASSRPAAVWSVGDLVPGSYEVFVSWPKDPRNAPFVPYAVLDGGELEKHRFINQRQEPVGEFSGMRSWQSLGTYEIDSTTLVVRADAPFLPAESSVRVVNRSERPKVVVEASGSPAEMGRYGEFIIKRDGSLRSSLTVKYSVGGTAEAGIDYQRLTGSVVIPVGASSATVRVNPINDQVFDPGEDVFLTILGDDAYDSSTTVSASLRIADDEQQPTASLKNVRVQNSGSSKLSGSFGISLSRASSQPVAVEYVLADPTMSQAELGSSTSGVVWFAPGEQYKSVEVPQFRDGKNAADSQLTVQLRRAQGAQVDSKPVRANGLRAPLPQGSGGNVVVLDAASFAEEGRLFVVLPMLQSSGTAITSVTVTWGDGQQDTYSYLPSELSHIYADGPIPRTINLSYVDGGGSQQAEPIEVQVVDVAPQITVSGVYTPQPPAINAIIDNGAAGFGTTGSWSLYGQGFENDIHWKPAGNGSSTASWTFANLSAGTYRVSATWPVWTSNATDAPFTILDGSTPVLTALVNQELYPNDLYSNGASWEDLGTSIAISSGTLVVSLSDLANQDLIADAIRIERIGDLPGTTTFNPLPANEGAQFTLSFSASEDPGQDSIVSWIVDWGDGTSDTLPASATSATHTYADGDATHHPILTLVDDDGTHSVGTDGTDELDVWVPDQRFDHDGQVSTVFPGGYSGANATAFQADGKLIVAGSANADFAVVRYDANGSLDTSFGGGDGVVTIDFNSGYDAAYGVIIQPDGRILVGGGSGGSGTAITRLNVDGSLDATFGGDGKVLLSDFSLYSSFAGFAQQDDGKIVVGGSYGMTVTRLNADGSLDTSFANGAGYVSVGGAGYTSTVGVGVQSGGRIVIGGNTWESTGELRVVGISSSGVVDETFGTNGVTAINLPGAGNYSAGFGVDNADRIVMAGYGGGSMPNLYDFWWWIARLGSAGTIDSSFGSAGIVTTNVIAGYESIGSMSLTSDDGILITGGVNNPSTLTWEGGVILHKADGTRDLRLENDGLAYIAGGYLYGVAATASGDIAVVGTRDSGGFITTVLTRDTTFDVEVANVSPILDMSGPAEVDEGSPYVLNLSAIDPGDDTIIEWEINWGDGQVELIPGNPSSWEHIYADGDAPPYTITARARDEDGWFEFSPAGGEAGSLDTSFGGDGRVIVSSSGALDVVVQADGKIVVLVYGYNGFAVIRHNEDGSLDSTFDGDGQAVIDMPGDYAQAYGVALQSDGKIVLVGYVYSGGNSNVAMVRLETNGAIDTSFGASGYVVTDLGGYDEASDVAISSDGKIVVAANGGVGNDLYAIRYLANGNLDSSFSVDGIASADLNSWEYARRLAVQSDGKVIVVGDTYSTTGDFAIARFDVDGTLDTSFDEDGKVNVDFGVESYDNAYDVIVQGDGKIVLAGRTYAPPSWLGRFALARLTSSGQLDTNFSGDGLATVDFVSDGENYAYGSSAAIQSDGKIVMAGYGGDNGIFVVARLNPNGSLDNTFDGDGRVSTDFDEAGGGGSWSYADAVAIAPDGKIVVAGGTYSYPSGGGLALARYHADSQNASVAVNNVAPTLTLSGNEAAIVGYAYTLHLGVSDPGQDTIDHWTIDWGDDSGVNNDGIEVVTGNPSSLTHIYSTAGNYTVTATATDEDGTWAANSLEVNAVAGVVLEEGTSFLVDYEFTNLTQIEAGVNAITVFYAGGSFAGPDGLLARDAFELALVDGNGRPLVGTIQSGRDAFFNVSESLGVTLGGGANFTGAAPQSAGFVTLDVSHFPAGTPVRLIARLVNNDEDTATTVTLLPIVHRDAVSPVANPTFITTPSNAAGGAIDTRVLADITPLVTVEHQRTSFNEDNGVLHLGLNLTNAGSVNLRGPLAVAVRLTGAPGVAVHQPDGATAEGLPYFNLTSLATGSVGSIWSGGETITGAELRFVNPDHVQFDYELIVLAQPNRAPMFTTSPGDEATAGESYSYDTDAIDPDGDVVSYELVVAPAAMTIDSQGVVSWATTTGDVGTHSVIVRAADGLGGVVEQAFTINVVAGMPNRPPVFTSFPMVDAYVNVGYSYQAMAFDIDGDDLTFTAIAGPDDLDFWVSANGLVTWTPNAGDVGDRFTVTLRASDGNGGTVDQSFDILVHAEPGNTAPVFVTTPTNSHRIPTELNDPAGDVNPQAINLDLAPGQTSEVAVTFRRDGEAVPNPGAIDTEVAGVISGQLFHDLDEDGVKDANEYVLPGWTVFIDQDNDQQLDPGEVSVLTDSAGNYQFTGLAAGTYDIVQVVKEGWWQTTPVESTRWIDLQDYPGPNGPISPLATVIENEVYVSVPAFNHFFDVPNARYDVATHSWVDDVDNSPFNYSAREAATAFAGKHYVFQVGYFGALEVDILDPLTGSWETRNYINEGDPWFEPRNAVAHGEYIYVLADGPSYVVLYRYEPTQGTWAALEAAPFTSTFGATMIAINNELFVFGGINGFTAVNSVHSYHIEGGWESLSSSPMPTARYGMVSAVIDGQIAVIGGQTIFADDNSITNVVEYFDPATEQWSEGVSLPYPVSSPAEGLIYDSNGYYVIGGRSTSGTWLNNVIRFEQVHGFHRVTLVEDGGAIHADFGNSNGEGTIDVELEFSDPQAPVVLTQPANPVVADVNPGETISYTVQFTSNGDGHTFMLEFVDANYQTPLGLIPVTINAGYHYGALAVDADGDSLIYSLVGEDHGATVDAQTGALTWSPLREGDYSFTLMVSDGRGGVALQDFTVEVSLSGVANAAPIIDSTAPSLGRIGGAYVYNVEASDADGDALDFYLDNGAPAGMAIGRHTGQINWTPGSTQSGTHVVTVKAYDRRGGIDEQVFTITVSDHVNTAPQFNAPFEPSLLAAADARYYIQLGATDIDGDALTFDLPVAPAGMTIDAATGSIGWKPLSSQIGDATVVARVSDGYGGIDIERFVLRVVNPNEAPVFTSAPATAGTTLASYAYFASVEDANGDDASFRLDQDSVARGMSVDAASGYVTWAAPQAGLWQVTLTADDERGGIARQTYVLRVLSNNQLPYFISSPTSTVDVGDAWIYTPSVNDAETPANITVRLIEGPQGMTVTANGGNYDVQWTPTTPEVVDVVIEADDGNGGLTRQRFSIQAIDDTLANLPPQIVSTPPGPAVADRLYQYPIEVIDPNGDGFFVSLVDGPVGMSVHPFSSTLNWLPDVGGVYRVTVMASSGPGYSSTQTFDLVVLDNAPPVIETHALPVGVVNVPMIETILASDPNGDAFTYRLSGQPAGMTIDAQGLLTWTPTAAGEYPVDVVVEDGRGGQAVESYIIRVKTSGANHAPLIESDPRTSIQYGLTYFYQVAGVDADFDVLTYSVTGPAGMTIDSTGLIQWTPSAVHATVNLTPHAVTVSVSDGINPAATQNFDLVVTLQPANAAPQITTNPPTSASADQIYRYSAAASDADNDVLFWRVLNAPRGLAIDPDTGVVRWTPGDDQVGNHTFTVQVQDPYGGMDSQVIEAVVRGSNRSPQFTSTPPTIAGTALEYVYRAKAVDPEGDSFTFALVQPEPGMSIDAVTGVLTWASPVEGLYTVTVTATDRYGAVGVQTYQLIIDDEAENLPPVITSLPRRYAPTGVDFTDLVEVDDPNGVSGLLFVLADAPAGMAISPGIVPGTGEITWDELSVVAGTYVVRVTVTDPGGLVATQRYQLVVRGNTAPTIDEVTGTSVEAGAVYSAAVPATDADGDSLTYSLSAGHPAGMSIDSRSGVIAWTTAFGDIGSHPVTVNVTDSFGATDSSTFAVVVGADTIAPAVVVETDEDTVQVDTSVTIRVLATDNVGIAYLWLTIDGEPITVNADGTATFTPDQAGSYSIFATALDYSGNQTISDELILTVVNPNETAPVVVFYGSLTDVDGGVEAIEEPTDVLGSVSDLDGNLVEYTLSLVPRDGGDAIELVHEVALPGQYLANVSGTIAVIDPTLIANGSYTLVLTATDGQSNTSTISQPVEIQSQLKLGNFRVSFTDLSLNVGGFPVSAVRTYDSLNANRSGDFGYGWQLDVFEVKMDIDLPASARGTELGILPGYQPGTRIHLTLPDGSRESFTFGPKYLPPPPGFGNAGKYAAFLLGQAGLYAPGFYPDEGVTGTLALNQDLLIVKQQQTDQYVTSIGLPFNPASPYVDADWIYTARDGTQYHIDSATGELQYVNDRAGNQLVVGDRQIISRNAIGAQTAAIDITRDHLGRITAITDPAGESVRYAYDHLGDLVRVTDRIDEETTLIYDPLESGSRPHFLTDIVDARGVTVLQTQFDETTGRLENLVDAAGQTIDFGYELNPVPGQHRERLEDAFNVATELVRDSRGNVIRRIQQAEFTPSQDPIYVITVFEYQTIGSRSQQTRESFPFEVVGDGNKYTQQPAENGWRTQRAFDAAGNVTTETDALGNTTYYAHDLFGNVVATTDALGNSTANYFDSDGNLVGTSDALGNFTSFNYSGNNLTSVIDAAGRTVSTFAYDAQGRIASSTAAGGITTYFHHDENGNQTHSWYVATGLNGMNAFATVASVTAYDDAGRVTGSAQYELPGQNITTFAALEPALAAAAPLTSSSTTYTATGQVSTSTDPFGRVSENHYNSRGLLVMSRSQTADENGVGKWIVSLTVYDANGRATHSSDPIVEAFTASVAGERTVFASETIYDALGRAVETRRLENLTISVDADGSLHKTVIDEGHEGDVLWSSSTEYDAQGRVITSTDRTGAESTNLYNLRGDLIESRSQSLDENNVLQDIITRTLYDALGRPVYSTDPFIDGVTPAADITGSFTEYDALGRAFRTHRVRGLVIDIVTTSGVSQSVLADAGDVIATSQTFYDNTGRVTHTIGATGGRTDYEYDNHGRQIAVVGPAVDALNAAGQITQLRQRVETVYDAQGRREKVRDNISQTPGGTKDYSAVRETAFTYDAFNRVVETTFLGLPNNPVDDTTTSATFDSFGRRTSETDQAGRTRWFEFDEQGRLVAVILPAVDDPAQPDPQNPGQFIQVHPRYEYAYDALGNHVLIRDNVKHATVAGVPSTEPGAIDRSAVRETRFTYDEQGRQLTRTLPLGVASTGNPTDFLEQKFYDDLGRLDHEVSFEGRVTQYVYATAAGSGERLAQKRYFASVAAFANGTGTPAEITAYAYDAFGRMTETVQDRDGDLQTAADQRVVAYTFDHEGRVESIASPEGRVNYEYDAITGQRTRTWTGTNSASPNSDTRYTYDVLGRMTSVDSVARHGTAVTEAPTQYFYDIAGNLDAVVQSNPGGSIVAYYVYDALGRVELLRHFADADGDRLFDAGETQLYLFDYVLAPDGRRVGVTETDDQGNVTTIAWAYDGLSRLTSETYTGYDAEGTALSYKDEYTFDLVGNRLTKTHDHGHDADMDDALDYVVEYVYDANDRLLTETRDAGPDGSVTAGDTFTLYQWGPNADPLNGDGGDSTEQTLKMIYAGLDENAAIVETAEYVYNLQGRLAEAHIDRTVDSVTTETDTAYVYGDDGIRVKQTIHTDDGTTDTTTETTYLIDPANPTGYAQIIEEIVRVLSNPANADVLKAYVLGLDVIAQSTKQDVVGAVAAALQLLYDAHGSTRAVIDHLAAVVERMAYDAYGNNLAGATASTLTQLLYSGEVFDPAIGMQYLRARYYDPTTGGFPSFDAYVGDIFDPMSLHKFLYANADPENHIDPSGHFSLLDVLASIKIIGKILIAIWPVIQAGLFVLDAFKIGNVIGKIIFEGWDSVGFWEWAEIVAIAGTAFFGGSATRALAAKSVRWLLGIPGTALNSAKGLRAWVRSQGVIVETADRIALVGPGIQAAGEFGVTVVGGVVKPIIRLSRDSTARTVLHEYIHFIQYTFAFTRRGITPTVDAFHAWKNANRTRLEDLAKFIADLLF